MGSIIRRSAIFWPPSSGVEVLYSVPRLTGHNLRHDDEGNITEIITTACLTCDSTNPPLGKKKKKNYELFLYLL